MSNILYIDPEEKRSEIVEKSLSRNDNIEVTTASEAKEAVKESKEGMDIVISREDINGTPAYDIFKEVNSEQPETDFILFTGKELDDVRITEPTLIADYVDTKGDEPVKRLERHIQNLTNSAGTANYPLPDDESDRAALFELYRTINKERQEALDDLTNRLKNYFNVSTAYIGLISRDKEIYISVQGWEEEERPRCNTVCTFTILNPDMLVVDDLTKDERFNEVEKIQESGLKWYAGMPLKNKEGVKIGSICLMDEESHDLSDEDIKTLKDFSEKAEKILDKVRGQSDD